MRGWGENSGRIREFQRKQVFPFVLPGSILTACFEDWVIAESGLVLGIMSKEEYRGYAIEITLAQLSKLGRWVPGISIWKSDQESP